MERWGRGDRAAGAGVTAPPLGHGCEGEIPSSAVGHRHPDMRGERAAPCSHATNATPQSAPEDFPSVLATDSTRGRENGMTKVNQASVRRRTRHVVRAIICMLACIGPRRRADIRLHGSTTERRGRGRGAGSVSGTGYARSDGGTRFHLGPWWYVDGCLLVMVWSLLRRRHR